ncbi:hypothetical protein ACFQ4U_15360 [Micrococcus antarcticus]
MPAVLWTVAENPQAEQLPRILAQAPYGVAQGWPDALLETAMPQHQGTDAAALPLL